MSPESGAVGGHSTSVPRTLRTRRLMGALSHLTRKRARLVIESGGMGFGVACELI